MDTIEYYYSAIVFVFVFYNDDWEVHTQARTLENNGNNSNNKKNRSQSIDWSVSSYSTHK